MSLEKKAVSVRLADLAVGNQPKRDLPTLIDNCRRTHAELNLLLPYTDEDFASRPLVMAGEQLGVELRPATVQKVMIMSILAKKKGFLPVFLLEERDVISKAPKLTSWAFPSAGATAKGAEFSRIYASGLSASESKQLPLKFGVIEADAEKTFQQICAHYESVVEASLQENLAVGLDDIQALLTKQLHASHHLGEFGQRQLLAILHRLAIDNVVFCNLGYLEDQLWEQGTLDTIFSPAVRAQLVERQCVPEGSEVLWGEHLSDCHGRVRVQSNQEATCLRCGASLAREDWGFLSLRAIPRMLVIASFGVDLFVIGGTSEYNLQVLELFEALGRPLFPMIWKSGLSYEGPFQAASEEVAAATGQGKYTFLDALIGHTFSLEAGTPVADRPEPPQRLAHAYNTLSQNMLCALQDGCVQLVS